MNSKDSQGNSWTYGYDTNNKMNSLNKSQYGVSEKESITFDKDNKVTSFTLSQGTAEKLKQTVTYDKLGRMTTVGTALNGSTTQSPFLAKGYEFKNVLLDGVNSTTTLVSKETNGGTEKNYTYDAKGNILSISSSAGVITYTYDLISQLTKETNGVTGETIDYVYDTGGNILSKTITKNGVSTTTNYGYNDTNWRDKLTSFDGQNILYDQIGNPLSLNGATLGWTQGRKLSTYNKGGTTAYYTYDENGIRKSKYVNGTTTEYLTSGGEVVAQRTGSNVTTYTRGADGSLISMNRNGTIYYYQTNLQGDVEKILDGNGTAVVAYTYDAYGRITSTTGSMKDTLGVENPFRYRSYFFDQESGFYYLQSRYYDPMMGRFISADSQFNPDVNGGNVFVYCSNNPVMHIDIDGHSRKSMTSMISRVYRECIKQVSKIIMRNTISMLSGTFAIRQVVEIIAIPAKSKNLLNDLKKQNKDEVDKWLEKMKVERINSVVTNVQLPEDPSGLMYNKENRDYASAKIIALYPKNTSRTAQNISDEIFAHQFGADLTRGFLGSFGEKIFGINNPYHQFKNTDLNEDEYKHLGYKIVTILLD